MGPAVSQMDLAAEGILEDFEGNPVTAVGVEVRNAGGGLSDALDVDPVLLHGGDTVYVVMRCDVTGINHKPIKGDEGNWKRIAVMRATDATILDSAAVRKAIDTQRERIRREHERRKGVEHLFPDPEDDGSE
jgi:hypothetical protein